MAYEKNAVHVTVRYADGAVQTAELVDGEWQCEMCNENGRIMAAGVMESCDLAAELGQEIIGAIPEEAHTGVDVVEDAWSCTMEEMCNEECNDSGFCWICTRRKGHAGDHVAGGEHKTKQVCHVWPQAPSKYDGQQEARHDSEIATDEEKNNGEVRR